MDTISHVAAPSSKCDPQIAKRWAAEDVAIAIGLLRECPYHGEPYKARRLALSARTLGAGLIDPRDPAVLAFGGNTRELLAAAERVAREYSDQCAFCRASEDDDGD